MSDEKKESEVTRLKLWLLELDHKAEAADQKSRILQEPGEETEQSLAEPPNKALSKPVRVEKKQQKNFSGLFARKQVLQRPSATFKKLEETNAEKVESYQIESFLFTSNYRFHARVRGRPSVLHR